MGKLRVNNKLWLVSDTHFGHRNIIKFQQRPESHEAIMLDEWIKRVGEHEQILHLGDVFMGPKGAQERWIRIVSRLPGEKFLLKGNHDKLKDSQYEAAGFTIIGRGQGLECPTDGAGNLVLSHEPYTEDWAWETNVHGHVHGNPYRPEHDGVLLEGKTYVNVCVEVTGYAPVRLGSVAPVRRSA